MIKFFKLLFLILAGGLFGFVLNVAFGDRVAARLSRVPILKEYKLVSSQAPIVIYTREEVRSRGDEDILAALEKSKRKVSAVLVREAGYLKFLASALNLTSEGLFLTASEEGGAREKYIQLSDGSLRVVTESFTDPASGLEILRASGGGDITVAGFGDSRSLRAGERVLLLAGGFGQDNPRALTSFVSEKESQSGDVEAGYFNSLLQIQDADKLSTGQVVVNISGDIVGLWNGGSVVPASVLGEVSRKFLAEQKFQRPSFGFAFHQFNDIETRLLGGSTGNALVLRVAVSGSAALGGLKSGDVVVRVGDKLLTESPFLEERLLDAEVGKALIITVLRGGKEAKLSVVPGELR